MNERKGKIMLVMLVMMTMLLSSFAVIPMGATAANFAPKLGASVGTVTLDPAEGAFPGQIVYYTWTGVPTDLVEPVYVTVYMNGAAYSTDVATYDSVNGVLKGTFVMPNDEPGTVFDISFSYRDSAKNYNTQTVSGYTTVEMGIMPENNAGDTSEDSQYRYEFGDAQFNGNISLDGWESNSIDSYDVDGQSFWDLNVSMEPHGFTVLSNHTPENQTVTFHNTVDFSYEGNFTNNTYARNVTVNVNAKDDGPFSLSLPASNEVPTVFTFNSAGDTITQIKTTFYVNTTVSGVLVSFKFDGIYTVPITSVGTYTLPGHFVAVSPSTLDMSGQFSASYDIVAFGYDGTNYYVNYTLSITFNGQSSDGVVVLDNAQYKNEDPVNDSATTQTVESVNTLTLFGNYQFYSRQVAVENPGLVGEFVFNYENTTYHYWVNGTNFDFSKYLSGDIDNGIPPLYFNQSIAVNGLNETLVGRINITLYTNYYIPGVYDIAPVIWNFTMNMSFSAESPSGKITMVGSIVNPGNWGALPSFEVSFITTSYGPKNDTIQPYMNSTLTTLFGYPKIDYVYLHDTFVEFTYHGQVGRINLLDTIISVNEVVTPGLVGATHYFYGNRDITGLNETLSHGIYNSPEYNDTQLDITYNEMHAAVYGVSHSGWINATFKVEDWANNTGHLIELSDDRNYITAIIPASETPTSWTADIKTYDYDLKLDAYYWVLHDAHFTAYLNVSFAGYEGYLNFSGAGGADGINVLLTSGTSIGPSILVGNITGLEGFANNSMSGYFNASLYVPYAYPALYGGLFNGYYTIYADFDEIKKNTTDYPFFDGWLETTIYTEIPSNGPITPDYGNYQVTGELYDGYMEITSLMRVVNITNSNISGSISMSWPAYGTTHEFTFYTGTFDISGGASGVHTHVWWQNDTYGYGYLHLDYSGTPVDYYYVAVDFYLDVGAPIQNVSLIPVIDSSLYVGGYIISGDTDVGDYTTNTAYYYVEFGGRMSSSYSDEIMTLLPTEDEAPLTMNYDLYSPSVYFYNILPREYLTFQGAIGDVTFTTDRVAVHNVEDYFVTGTATSPNGMGTVTGVVHLNAHYPTTYYYYLDDNINVTAEFHIHIENNDGTHADITVTLPYAESYIQLPRYYSKTINNVPYTMSALVNEGSNAGEVYYGSFNLEDGSGALVVTLSDDQIATIVTRLGDVVNISIEQLDAKIVGLWNTANETYALLETAYGDMSAKLDTIDAKITDVQNGIATIQTTLGEIQTSLSDLNAKIISLQGDIATIKTDLGTINVKLDAINATVVSNANGIEDLKGSVVEIQTSLGDIEGIVTDINDGVATIQTDLGTVKTDVSDIKTTTSDTSSSVANTLNWNMAVLILVIITLVLVAFVIIKVNKIAAAQTKVEEETIEETGEE